MGYIRQQTVPSVDVLEFVKMGKCRSDNSHIVLAGSEPLQNSRCSWNAQCLLIREDQPVWSGPKEEILWHKFLKKYHAGYDWQLSEHIVYCS